MTDNGNGWRNWTRVWAALGMIFWLLILKWLGFQMDNPGKVWAAGGVLVLLLAATAGKSILDKLLTTLGDIWGRTKQ